VRWPDHRAHPAPEKAISDGAQSLDLAQFAKMMEDLKPVHRVVEGLAPERAVVAAAAKYSEKFFDR